jgi:hypothetical protein
MPTVGSPKYEKAALLRWLERYLMEGPQLTSRRSATSRVRRRRSLIARPLSYAPSVPWFLTIVLSIVGVVAAGFAIGLVIDDPCHRETRQITGIVVASLSIGAAMFAWDLGVRRDGPRGSSVR